ncbi:Emp24/gp25L/p24 family protein [Oesophagostomum dentatum]|uniref:Emp24/gp25L/p24 family protein n=1 Tax=Oesophagostomum dentatum TaxID=61180 RepID=A0A0B1TLA2_OESDE|nr:Emp24/gp25L/p24 family protein [Oesophagostomum dentatum]
MQLNQGDVISWWIVGNRNFGFGFFLAQNEEEEDFTVMDQMVPTFPWMPGPTITPLEGRIVIAEDGMYKFWISNERSWWSTLTVQLQVEVTEKAGDMSNST